MYRYFLAIRYLLSRPINVLGMIGVTLGVWALILVVSIFSGFLKVFRAHVQSATADVSVLAIQAILLLQLLSISLFSPYWVTESHEKSPHRVSFVKTGVSIFSSILPAWPFLAMLSLASGIPASKFGKAEALVLATGLTIALIARSFQNMNVSAEVTRLSQSFLGLAAASLIWAFRIDWFEWIVL